MLVLMSAEGSPEAGVPSKPTRSLSLPLLGVACMGRHDQRLQSQGSVTVCRGTQHPSFTLHHL